MVLSCWASLQQRRRRHHLRAGQVGRGLVSSGDRTEGQKPDDTIKSLRKDAQGLRESLGFRTVASLAFALTLATSVQAMSPPPLHQPDGISRKSVKHAARVGYELMASASPEPPSARFAGVRNGVEALAFVITETPLNSRHGANITPRKDSSIVPVIHASVCHSLRP